MSVSSIRRLAVSAAVIAAASGGAVYLSPSVASSDGGGGGPILDSLNRTLGDPSASVPSRSAQESALVKATSSNPLDVLVIGGGATGSGVALDAATRGLRVGVRYLEKAVFNLDYGQLKLVFHALEERKQLIENAPHLCHALPCMTPCFDWFEVVYYWMGLKMYDLVAGPRLLHLSRYYSAQESAELFPTLARKGKDKSLRGTVVYYDGQMNDSRLNVGLACTAALAGAAVLNHAEVVSLITDDVTKRIVGARVRNNLTDSVRRTDVLSAWSGIRPLAMDPTAKSTESISRDHVVFEEHPGLVTITGGKWTTYRSMAEDAVNAAIKSGKLSPTNGCVTQKLQLLGSHGWEPSSFTALAQQYVRMKKTYGGKVVPGAMDTAAAKHLSHAYGSMAERVATIAQEEGLGKRLAHGHPFLEAEVAYCARHEYCESAVDFIARRCRIAFLDTDAAARALQRVVEIMATEHKWDKSREKQEMQKAKEFLQTFKSSKNAQFHDGKHH
ncbi:hypothetical protein HID58_044491 [Brassica napus]|uniref:Glycerol-3-phosphate dehydrogenase n=1 Tax=Brassica napus TaxID=3708 RepID=A0ABQ8BKX7_BRANA|nr:hypothetical protein HID58_044491 [Brassica napus]